MPCYRPVKGYRSRFVNPDTGLRSIVFSARDGLVDQPVDLPCGRCIGCRLEYSRQWAIRCLHEASLYSDNCFITLTLNSEFLPRDGSLDKRLFQTFMKRLRFRFGGGVRFFHCGEYGERFQRPHYHACLFNFDFKDKYHWRWTDRGDRVWRSEELERLWSAGRGRNRRPLGQCEVGSVTFESAAYVARYITKKATGDDALFVYGKSRPKGVEGPKLWSGAFSLRNREYCTMSRRPGIGKAWFDRYVADVFPCDETVIRGRAVKVPKYYSSLYKRLEPDVKVRPLLSDPSFEVDLPGKYSRVILSRKERAVRLAELEPLARIAVREEVQFLSFKQLKRGYELE